MPFDVAAEVMVNTRLSADYNVIRMSAPEIAASARPGQFVMLKPAAGLDPMLRRPFSIFEILRGAGGAPLGISVLNKCIGRGTGLLYTIRPGDRIGCLGPLGQPFVPVEPAEHAWMVAGGVGLAPFASLGEALAARQAPTTLFYGARSDAELYYVDFFLRLGIEVVLSTEDGSAGYHGRITGPLDAALAQAAIGAEPLTIYACGPTPMMRAVARLGRQYGRPVFVSLEPVMGCGMGGCYSCVVPVQRGADPHFVRSCLDGPVFDASVVVWDRLSSAH